MIPKGLINDELSLTDSIMTSKTYKVLDTRIQGSADEHEALQQAIYKVLNTEKYEYPIYSFNYGIELDSLIGKDPAYVQIEMKRRIRECLLQDERIKNVDNFNFTITGDELFCTFSVDSIYGVMTISRGLSR